MEILSGNLLGVCLGTNQELNLLGDWGKICLGIDFSAQFAWGSRFRLLGELEELGSTFLLGISLGGFAWAVAKGCFNKNVHKHFLSIPVDCV